MHLPSTRPIAALAGVAIFLTGCGVAPKTPGTTTPATPPSPTSQATTLDPNVALTWEGDTNYQSPTWAEDVDPKSEYGLHRARGLKTILKPETRVLSEDEANQISNIRFLNETECLADTDPHPMCRYEIEFMPHQPGCNPTRF